MCFWGQMSACIHGVGAVQRGVFYSRSHLAMAVRLFLYTKGTLMWATLANSMHHNLTSFVFVMYRWWQRNSVPWTMRPDYCSSCWWLSCTNCSFSGLSYRNCVRLGESLVSNFVSAISHSSPGLRLIAVLGLGPVTPNRPCLRRHTSRCTSTSSRGATLSTYIKWN
jgi:hypothetical protein